MSFDIDTNSFSESSFTLGGLDPLSPRNPFGPSQSLFTALGQGPQAMPGLPNLSSLNWDTGLQGQGKDQFETSFSSPLQNVLDEPESVNSWVDKVLPDIPIVDTTVKSSAEFITNSSVFIEQAAESSKLLVKDTAEGIGDTVRNWVTKVAGSWNDPSNGIHNELNHQARTFVDGLGELATDVGNSQWLARVKTRLGSASEGLDSWIGGINSSLGYVDNSLTTQEATVLAAAELRLQENLVNLSENPDFLKTFETAFGDDIEVSEATELVSDFVSGDGKPDIKVLAAADLKGEGAFGDNTIFVSDQLLAQSSDNTEVLDAVLLEEAGHYFDQELNATDSAGDEGEIFSRLARGQAIADGDLLRLKREDDRSTLVLDDRIISVENYIPDVIRQAENLEETDSDSSPSIPVNGSDRRLYIQAGTVDVFDAALDAQQESSADSTSIDIPAENGSKVVIAGSGDTLSAIAAQHGVQWTDLRKPNGEAFTEEEARLLQIGNEVILPNQSVEEPVSPPPETVTPVNGSDRHLYLQAGTVDQFDAALAAQQSSSTGLIDDENFDSVAIAAGNTLSEIAAQHGVEWTDLRKPNGEAFTQEEARSLQVGDQVLLPGQSVSSPTPSAPDNPQQADLAASQPESGVTDRPEEQLQDDIESLNEQIEALGTSSPSVTQALQNELNPLESELKKLELEEQIEAIGTSSPYVTQALEEELNGVETELTQIELEEQREQLLDEEGQLLNEAESLDEQIHVLGTSSPSVTQVLQEDFNNTVTELNDTSEELLLVEDELDNVETKLTITELKEQKETLVNDSEQLRNDVESLDSQIEGLGTSSYSVTKALQEERRGLETELTSLDNELSEVTEEIDEIELEQRKEKLSDEVESLNRDIEALGTSSPSVTQALEEELGATEKELDEIEQEEQQASTTEGFIESEVTADQFDELNEKVQNWQGSDNDPIFDQLVRDRDAAFENLIGGFDDDFAVDIEEETREGESFTEAYEEALNLRNSRISSAGDEITDLLHTDSQSGWTPWTDGDREVTSEEAFAVFEALTKLNDYEAAAVLANLTEEQIEKLEVVLDQGQYTESTGLLHALDAPFRVVGRAVWDTGDGILDIPRAAVAWSEVYYDDATTIVPQPGVGDQNGYFGVHDEAAMAAGDVLTEGNAPFLSNLVRCQRGDNTSCWLLGVEVVFETVGGPVAGRVSSVIGRAGSRLLVRFTTSQGDEVVTAISESTARQVLRNTDGSPIDFEAFGSEFIDDGLRMADQPSVIRGSQSSELPRFEPPRTLEDNIEALNQRGLDLEEAQIQEQIALNESAESVSAELGDVPSSWGEAVPRSHFEGAPEINTRTTINGVENAHDIGVQEGRRYAVEELGLSDPDFLVNPFEFHGSYGQGFDDIMRDVDGNLVIVEYKGGTARLSASQMSHEWVVSRIQRMRDRGGALGNFNADILQEHLEQGTLKGVALSTPAPRNALPEATRVLDTWEY